MEQKQQLADRIKQANNVLVTVSNNPSVDQLASCIGLTLALNKMGKHATAVFSGAVPSTIEFLQPEKTLEANTDSLRDFIISLDKSKADKLRYKVEDKVVKIFITPYRTSISEKDLEFGQGDFNVDVVVALGVHDQGELDQAITAHGRILHDATVATINTKPGGELGSINLLVPGASSLSELSSSLVSAIDKSVVDEQIATSFLTGIVAETQRFSNEKTSPDTMSISAELMAAGANQQLVATKLEEPKPEPPPPPPPEPAPQDNQQPNQGDAGQNAGQPQAPTPPPEEPPKPDDGTLEIAHDDKPQEDDKPVTELDELSGGDEKGESDEEKEKETPRIHIDDQGSLHNIAEMNKNDANKPQDSTGAMQHPGGSRMILEPPSMGGAMSASGASDEFKDPLSLPKPGGDSGDGSNNGGPASSFAAPSPASATTAPSAAPFMPSSMTPGGSAESSSGEQAGQGDSNVGSARGAVDHAFGSDHQTKRLEPIHALNAQPLGDQLHAAPQLDNGPPDLTSADQPAPENQQPAALQDQSQPLGAPPPVPPPMMPPQ